MKAIASLLVTSLLTLSLLACQSAVPAENQSYLRMKCPACGYEFDARQK